MGRWRSLNLSGTGGSEMMDDEHSESVDMVMRLLGETPELTTGEIENAMMLEGTDCPDGAAKTLMRLKTKGVLKSRLDPARKGWVWSVK